MIKSPKYLFFDLGIRRICANEGIKLPQKTLGDLFEHYVGNELIYQSQLTSPHIKIKYWRDLTGPEVDFVLDVAHQYIPIEVKWTDRPTLTDAKHLHKFMNDYPAAKQAYIICQTPQRYKISDKVIGLLWQEMKTIFFELATDSTSNPDHQ